MIDRVYLSLNFEGFNYFVMRLQVIHLYVGEVFHAFGSFSSSWYSDEHYQQRMRVIASLISSVFVNPIRNLEKAIVDVHERILFNDLPPFFDRILPRI